MLNFASDYIAGAHPAILKKLEETNMELFQDAEELLVHLRVGLRIGQLVAAAAQIGRGRPLQQLDFKRGSQFLRQVAVLTVQQPFHAVRHPVDGGDSPGYAGFHHARQARVDNRSRPAALAYDCVHLHVTLSFSVFSKYCFMR